MDENVMRVLELLQEGKITAQEAEMLIAALRGGSKTATSSETSKESQTKSEQKAEEKQTSSAHSPFAGLSDLGERISKAISKVDVDKIVERVQEQLRLATKSGGRFSSTFVARMRTWTKLGTLRPENESNLPERTETQQQEFYLASGANVSVDNPLGDVKITGVADAPAKVVVKSTVWAPNEIEIKNRLERIETEISSTDSRLEIRIEAPEDFDQGTVDLEITVPRALGMTHVKTRFGKVEIAHVDGTVEVVTDSGSVSLEDIGGNVRVQTNSDSIHLKQIRGTASAATKSGNIEASDIARGLVANTASGDIRAKAIEGERLECKSVSGDVRVEEVGTKSPMEIVCESISGQVYLSNVHGQITLKIVSGNIFANVGRTERFQAQSVSGDISVDFQTPFSGALQASTVSGDVDIGLPPESHLRVTLGTISGTLRCEHDAREVTATGTLWTGTLGEGIGTLNVQTTSGDVHITRVQHTSPV
ncbi:DUF4097 family beta strand repeat-containing protein [Chthonomonas calidirosea]|uniref:DUF4097 family beta strand repeat-containing protein n=1 Tax=Chthonomonas calidirosea TaxID=454171 RepID=UPI0006ECC2F9|nr:DUF4097 family beta strand repeat-containing protein [Chthonomonas calidirosea]CEK17852.1 Domain of unknown function (DUF4098) [Chthonomonas calidirosea]